MSSWDHPDGPSEEEMEDAIERAERSRQSIVRKPITPEQHAADEIEVWAAAVPDEPPILDCPVRDPMPEQTALGELGAWAAMSPRGSLKLPLHPREVTGTHPFVKRAGMTALNKILTVACAILAITVIYLSRDEVTASGPRSLLTRIHNRWTGTVVLCYPDGNKCTQVYPPSDAPDKRD
jgi:hypothetical protein